MLRFTDSLTGDKVDFVPREEGKASVYWCGPPVYDVPHLGHARSTLAFDLLGPLPAVDRSGRHRSVQHH
ncbi:MAG: hypothetical protein CM1200mP26_03680 [Acidimicrobiales bacterium]|nr:MAG: hypothetical protein CM1200mP26_03680 [Acidimicrobiales bacterium]